MDQLTVKETNAVYGIEQSKTPPLHFSNKCH
jgi:hypothetical protein